jgi:hypothetical protein
MAGPCSLPRSVAIETRQPQDGTVKKGLHRPRLSAIIPIITAAGSHPDCRAVLIQIVALYWVPHDSLCIPSGTEYEDMVQVVVSWTELSLRRNPEGARDFRVLTEAAFRSTWGCKQ